MTPKFQLLQLHAQALYDDLDLFHYGNRLHGPSRHQPELRTEYLLKFMQHKPHSVFTKKAKFFLLSLALCHTCLPEVKENGDIEFQAASPDELALVRAAQELGWLVIDRPAQSITLTYLGLRSP